MPQTFIDIPSPNSPQIFQASDMVSFWRFDSLKMTPSLRHSKNHLVREYPRGFLWLCNCSKCGSQAKPIKNNPDSPGGRKVTRTPCPPCANCYTRSLTCCYSLRPPGLQQMVVHGGGCGDGSPQLSPDVQKCSQGVSSVDSRQVQKYVKAFWAK